MSGDVLSDIYDILAKLLSLSKNRILCYNYLKKWFIFWIL